MQNKDINRFCFQGEVIEDFHQDGQRWMKTLCKPGKIIIQIPEDREIQLGDRIKITCSLEVDELEKLCNSH